MRHDECPKPLRVDNGGRILYPLRLSSLGKVSLSVCARMFREVETRTR